MTSLKRLSVVMSVFGAGLVVAACASPTDAEIAEQPAQQDDVATADGEDFDTTSSALTDEAEEAAEDVGREAEDTAEDVERGAEDAAEDVTDGKEEGSVAQEQQYGYGQRPGGYGQRPGGYGHGRRCDYRNVSHCVRNHRGWRWVDLGGRYRGHGGYGYGQHGPRHGGNYCCMRVQIRDHRGGPHGF